MKLITIIIATYNAEKVLQRCLDSIKKQKSPLVEVLIVDGHSKDKTLEIIKSNSDIVDNYISEPDKGIYDAWNKGIRLATGSWIEFLGADDILFPNVLPQIEQLLQTIPPNTVDILSTKTEIVDENGNHKSFHGELFDYTKFVNKRLSFAHPSMFQNRRIFELYGDFNIKYRIVADSEFYMRNGKNFSSKYLDIVTVKMQQGGVSVSYKGIWQAYKMRSSFPETNTLRNISCALRLSIVLFLSKVKNILNIK